MIYKAKSRTVDNPSEARYDIRLVKQTHMRKYNTNHTTYYKIFFKDLESENMTYYFSQTHNTPTVHTCTKFQPSRPHSSWEICDEKFKCFN